jgi:hypothetical protein
MARSGSDHLIVADAATGALRREVVLAGGRVFGSDAEQQAAGVEAGTLGNASAIRALAGTTSAFVVGSTDGYLYALDACGTPPGLVWSLSFGAPVGQSIFADTDGDGDEELVVTAADGYVYGLDTQRFEAPRFVFDTDPEHGFPDTDVDEIRGLAVHALWSPVAGAVGYEWALFTAGGRPVTQRPGAPDNPFIPVDAAQVRADVRAGLAYGGRYYFAVRAIGPDGSSSEALSDGVRILPEDGPMGVDGGVADAARPHYRLTGDGCGSCGVPRPVQGGSGLGALASLGVALLGARRLRRGRGRR